MFDDQYRLTLFLTEQIKKTFTLSAGKKWSVSVLFDYDAV